MPELSRFLGIVIAMFYRDHAEPHFHVRYAEFRAAFSIEKLQLIEGQLPPRVIALVLEWAFRHREELARDWQLAAEQKPLRKIEPLA